MPLLSSKAHSSPLLEVLETVLVSSSHHLLLFFLISVILLLYSSYSLPPRCRAEPQNRNKKSFLLSWTLNCHLFTFPLVKKKNQKCCLLLNYLPSVSISLLCVHCLTPCVWGCTHKFLSCYDYFSCIPRAFLWSSFLRLLVQQGFKHPLLSGTFQGARDNSND